MELTPASLRRLCRELNLYASVPELNDVLHLHCKGIIKIQNLDAYFGLKTLYLESNAISVIEGLEKLTNLKCLYLGKNLIHRIDGLQSLSALVTLDLSDNDIRAVENLSCLPLLQTLNLSMNKLKTAADIRHLTECPSLACLDLANNKLCEEEAMEIIMTLPLALLRLVGNPIVSSTKHYRKRVMASMPDLHNLDDLPCFEKERRLAEAFVAGGMDAERAMRRQILDEEAAKREANARAFDEMVRRAKEEALRNPPPPRDPMRFRAVPPGESDSEDELLPPAFARRKQRPSTANEGPEPGDTTLVDGTLQVEEDADASVEAKDAASDERPHEAAGLCSESTQNQDSAQTLLPFADVSEGGAEANHHRETEEALSGRANRGTTTHTALIRQESDFQEELRRRALQRAAARAEARRTTGDAEERQRRMAAVPKGMRPMVWGTPLYRKLWNSATSMPEVDAAAAGMEIAQEPDLGDEATHARESTQGWPSATEDASCAAAGETGTAASDAAAASDLVHGAAVPQVEGDDGHEANVAAALNNGSSGDEYATTDEEEDDFDADPLNRYTLVSEGGRPWSHASATAAREQHEDEAPIPASAAVLDSFRERSRISRRGDSAHDRRTMSSAATFSTASPADLGAADAVSAVDAAATEPFTPEMPLDEGIDLDLLD